VSTQFSSYVSVIRIKCFVATAGTVVLCIDMDILMNVKQ
jgi:hypothetical protein